MKRALAAGAALFGVLFLTNATVGAHPLGNFSVNHYDGLALGPHELTLDLVTDMAEIPSYQARADIDTNHDGTIDDREAATWGAQQCAAQITHISVRADKQRVDVEPLAPAIVTFPPGQAGLATTRLECRARAALPTSRGAHALDYHDANFDGRLGWRELVATTGASGALLSSDLPATSVTARLTHYPADLLKSPLNQTTATLRYDGGTLADGESATTKQPTTTPNKPLSILPRGVDRATSKFTSLVATRQLTVAFGLLAVVLAVFLGSLHALAPGHGKTVMAAYLVGQRGSIRQASLIAITVTVTHTLGVLALGVLLTTSAFVAPEQLYPWLSLASGLLLAAIGATLFHRARTVRPLGHSELRPTPSSEPPSTRQPALVGAPSANQPIAGIERHAEPHDHHSGQYHHHGHQHADGHHRHGEPKAGHIHQHGGHTHTHPPLDPSLGWRTMLAVGFAGGLLPSPSALIVLLGAIALHRAWFGLILVIAYGAGMATMLTAAGLVLVGAREILDRRRAPGTNHRLINSLPHFVPLATSLLITAIGLYLAIKATTQI